MLDSVIFIAEPRIMGMSEGRCGGTSCRLSAAGQPYFAEFSLALRGAAGQHALGECGKKVDGRYLGAACCVCGL